jgi:gas vesicle protein
MEENNNRRMAGSGLMAGILIGGTLGFVAGMLLAPKSGGDMRTMLAERGQELRDKADELTAAARERIASATSEGRRAARRMRGQSSPFEEMDLDKEDL